MKYLASIDKRKNRFKIVIKTANNSLINFIWTTNTYLQYKGSSKNAFMKCLKKYKYLVSS